VIRAIPCPAARWAPRVRADAGAGSVLVIGLAACALALAGSATVLGQAVVGRHRAQSVADLAALAAAGPSGCPLASELARVSGARLLSCRRADDGTAVVTAAVALPAPARSLGPAVAVARAGPPPTSRGPGSSGRARDFPGSLPETSRRRVW
jgi:secretion/DNA translocation related TadE-like protein